MQRSIRYSLFGVLALACLAGCASPAQVPAALPAGLSKGKVGLICNRLARYALWPLW